MIKILNRLVGLYIADTVLLLLYPLSTQYLIRKDHCHDEEFGPKVSLA